MTPGAANHIQAGRWCPLRLSWPGAGRLLVDCLAPVAWYRVVVRFGVQSYGHCAPMFSAVSCCGYSVLLYPLRRGQFAFLRVGLAPAVSKCAARGLWHPAYSVASIVFPARLCWGGAPLSSASRRRQFWPRDSPQQRNAADPIAWRDPWAIPFQSVSTRDQGRPMIRADTVCADTVLPALEGFS